MARSVYVIDDDDAVRDSLSFLLETAGFAVETFESGARFLESFTGDEIGCIVTDVRMPGLSGLELAGRLRDLGSASADHRDDRPRRCAHGRGGDENGGPRFHRKAV